MARAKVPRTGEITPDQWEIFLDTFAECGHVGKSAKAARIAPTRVMQERRQNPQFEAQYQVAYEMGNTILEDEAVRRGVHGWMEPVFYRGVRVANVRKYSDQMLALLLKGRLRKIYGDQLGLNHGGQIGIEGFNYDTAIHPVTQGGTETEEGG
jgi:hypothetical protein